MKKILILIVLLLILILNCAKTQDDFTLKDYFPTGQLTCYTDDAKQGSSKLLSSVYITNQHKSVVGESIFLKNIEIDNAIKTLSAKVVLVETLKEQGLTLLFCHTNKVPTSVDYKGKKINIQIATCEDYTVIGWPMIIGSF